MITYNEFIDYLRDTELLDDIEIALIMYCIEEDYGSYLDALEANGYEEIDPDTYDEAMSSVANEYTVSSYGSGNYMCGNTYYYIFDDSMIMMKLRKPLRKWQGRLLRKQVMME